MTSEETKKEASVPVQSRVSMINLASLDEYWERQGVNIKTMSQLVSWSLELLCEVLDNNSKITPGMTVSDAWRRIEMRGLFQPSLKGRSIKRISTALAFENMRMEGVDPKVFASSQYNTLHKKNTVEVPTFKQPDFRSFHEVSDDELKDKMTEILKNRKIMPDGVGITREGMTTEDLLKKGEEDAELVKQQNKEMDKLLGIKQTNGGKDNV